MVSQAGGYPKRTLDERCEKIGAFVLREFGNVSMGEILCRAMAHMAVVQGQKALGIELGPAQSLRVVDVVESVIRTDYEAYVKIAAALAECIFKKGWHK